MDGTKGRCEVVSRDLRATSPAGPADDERLLLDRLRAGDEAAFMELVARYQASLTRVARHYVRDPEAASEVVQDTWLGVLRGLDRFEGRASLRTWIFRILVNRARTRGARDSRTVAFSALDLDEPAVDPERFRPNGHWDSRPTSWDTIPEAAFLARETIALVRAAIDELPASQREVIVLRDIEGWSAAEACAALEISESNQRVLLHRARSRVRRALEAHLSEKH